MSPVSAAGEGKRPSIHTGHRKRAKEEFLRRGLNGMAPHKVLELVLFYAVPQGDVNPLAHELVERFGGIQGVFHATYDQLLQVKGVGPNTAILLRLIPEVAGYYMGELADLGGRIEDMAQVEDLLASLYAAARSETAYLLCLDGKNKLITCREIGEGIADQVTITGRKVLETALECNATKVILAHNHTSGVALFSQADVRTTQELWRILRRVGVELVDHLVYAGGEMVSMAASGIFNEFRDWAVDG